ncbi:MAG: glutathione S-transferase family protein [Burkholderiaceae bacterium]|jgi:glutathione S-transferase|nr:glutathione S-transferase family protein [Burkholderiaceae bacterium]MEB2320405.1 glutathione S-transferase family protein [Pseudomonadota bacterium]
MELYFAPGACSFVPHVGLEIVRQKTGEGFEPKLIKLHKGEHQTPEYLAINPEGQVPVLVVDGKPLTQILAIADYLDHRFPKAGLLPTDPWERAQAISTLAWFNNTLHPTFTHVFMPHKFSDDKDVQQKIRSHAVGSYRGLLEKLQGRIAAGGPIWSRTEASLHDAYAFTLLRWAGFAGIDPASLPGLKAYVESRMSMEPMAAAMARERVALDTYKPAA